MLDVYFAAMQTATDPHKGDAYRAIVLRLQQEGTKAELIAWANDQMVHPRFAGQDEAIMRAFIYRLRQGE